MFNKSINLLSKKFTSFTSFVKPFIALVCNTEFAPTPVPQHPHGHLRGWILSLASFPFTISFVFSVFIFSPLCSIHPFQLLNMSATSSFDSAVITESSAQSSFHGPSPLANLVASSITVIKSRGLRADPWCTPTLMSKASDVPATVSPLILIPHTEIWLQSCIFLFTI